MNTKQKTNMELKLSKCIDVFFLISGITFVFFLSAVSGVSSYQKDREDRGEW